MFFWAEMNSQAIEENLKSRKVVIVPIGSLEQHGPHLPAGTDTFIGWEIAKKVAAEVDAMLLPIIPIGFSKAHCPKAGTITLSADTVKYIIKDIAISLSEHEVENIIVLSGHAGHLVQIADVCYELNVYGKLGKSKIYNISPYNTVKMEELAQILDEEVFLHAEELETSLMLFFNPKFVEMNKAVKEIPDYIPKGLTTQNYLEAIRIFTTSKFFGKDLKTGVCGDATLATEDKGKKISDLFVKSLVNIINELTK